MTSLCRRLATPTRRALRVSSIGSARSLHVLAASRTGRKLTHHTTSAHQRRTSLPFVAFRRSYAGGDPLVVKVPGMGDSITEGELSSWSVAEGTEVGEDELVCEIETDKINVEIRAPQSGVVLQHFAAEGDTVAVGADLYKLQPGDVAAKTDAPAPPKAEAPKAEPAKKEAPAKPAPAAAPEKPAAPAKAAPTQSSTSSSSAPAKPAAASGARGERRVKMKKIRIRIADRLKDSQNTYAMLTTFNEVDMSALIALRNKYKDLFEKEHGVKLGFMSPFLKAAATALQTIPAVNAVIDGPEIVYRDYVDISVAVASPAGLVVPVIRNVETLSLADIERSIGDAAAKARDGTLSMEEMAGGTFTVSNGGVFGSLMGTPIINPPQSAILGMHATNPRPVAIDGKVEIRPMMYIALTYDHRLIDGREAATFLVQVKRAIEDPGRMLLGV